MEFEEGGKVPRDIAKVRFDYFNMKRKSKILAVDEELRKEIKCKYS